MYACIMVQFISLLGVNCKHYCINMEKNINRDNIDQGIIIKYI